MKLITATTAGYRSLPRSAPEKKKKPNFKEGAKRRWLAKEWETLSPEEQASLRVQRAKAGIKCNICGGVGYYRETCPKKCTVADILFKDEPPDPDDDNVGAIGTPNIGAFWGTDKVGQSERTQEVPVDSNISRLRERMHLENAHLKEADGPLQRYQFFVQSQDGYNRNIGELTLHQVLRFLVRVVDHDLAANKATLESKLDLTLFHPPRTELKEDFYPDEVADIPEYRDYLYSLKNKPDKVHRAYNNRSHMRSASMLDPIFRGSDPHGDHVMFVANPDAAQPIHSQLGWKDTMATNDSLANSDPVLQAKHVEFKKNFERQSEWVQKQAVDMNQRTERYAHLALVIRDEIRREHERESRMLGVPFSDKKRLNHLTRELWKERIEAADRIMYTLKAYNIGSSGSAEADYLVFCLDEWIKYTSNGQRSFASENARYAKYGKVDDAIDTADESALIQNLKGKKIGSQKKKNKHKKDDTDIISSSQQALVQTYMTADMIKFRDKENAVVEKYSKKAKAYRQMIADEKVALKNQASLEQQRRDALVAKRMTTISFNNAEKPSKFETRSLASISVCQRQTDRSYASSVVLEAIPSISKSTQLLEESNQQYRKWPSPDKASISRCNYDTGEKGVTNTEIMVSQGVIDNSRSQKLLAASKAAVKNHVTEASGNSVTHSKEVVVTRKDKFEQLVPVEKKRVFVSEAMRDREKMKETAAVFKRMDMDKHIRKGDFKDSTQRTPVLIPLHKVLAVDPPEDEMISYSAVKDVYHQKTKYANKVTGFSREKFVPLFARTTLVEKNGVTPGTPKLIDILLVFPLNSSITCKFNVLRRRSALYGYGGQ